MSLATRCTNCGTVFRVVQDQLKVSEGWVRCGRCNKVFNALEGLFDLRRDTPLDSPVDARVPSFEAPAAVESRADSDSAIASAEAAPAHADDALSMDAIDKIDAQLMHARELGQLSTPATRISERDRLEFPDARFDSDILAEDTVDLRTPGAAVVAMGEPSAAPVAAVPPTGLDFEQRRARRSSPRTRALQAAMLVVLLFGLGLQMLNQFRNEVAARWPETSSLVAAWCSAMGCTIAAPQRLESVVVESTALTSTVAPDALRLSVVLRNRGDVTVALPSVDLGLTNASGQLVARRMLSPKDFRVATAAIRPGAESALQLVLSLGTASVTGYTVEVFYP